MRILNRKSLAIFLALLYHTEGYCCNWVDWNSVLNINNQNVEIVNEPVECNINVTNGAYAINSAWIKAAVSIEVDSSSSMNNKNDINSLNINNNGTFVNSGNISGGAESSPSVITNNGQFANYGDLFSALINNSLMVNAGSVRMIGGQNSGVINNSGLMHISNDYYTLAGVGMLTNNGVINNAGTIQTSYSGFIENKNTIYNAGMMDMGDGTINNFGKLINNGSISFHWAAPDGMSGALNNSGELSGVGDISFGFPSDWNRSFATNQGVIAQKNIYIGAGSVFVNHGQINSNITVIDDSTLKSDGVIFGNVSIRSGVYILAVGDKIISINGSIDNVGGDLILSFVQAQQIFVGEIIHLFDISGDLASFDNIKILGLTDSSVNYNSKVFRDGSGVYLNITAVPEPEAAVLCMVGFLMVARIIKIKKPTKLN